MPGTLAPSPWFTGFDDVGDPLVGGKLYTYLAGTSQPQPVYTDVRLETPHPNPVILDAGGRATMYLDVLSYKFELRDANDALIRTQDNIISVGIGGSGGSGGGVGTEVFSFGGGHTSPITSVTHITGNTFDTLHAGTGVMEIDSSTMIGSYAIDAMMSVAESTMEVEVALVNLTDGSPDTPMVTAQSTSATGEHKLTEKVIFPAGGTVKRYGIKTRMSQPGVGYVWQIKLVRMAEA